MSTNKKSKQRIEPTVEQNIEASNLAKQGLQQERLVSQNSAAELLRSTLKTLLTINGGGAVALLAFAGHIFGNQNSMPLMAYIVYSIVAFCCGVVLTAGTYYFSYESEFSERHSVPHPNAQYAHTQNSNSQESSELRGQELDWWKVRNKNATIANWLGFFAAGAFIVGVGVTSYGLLVTSLITDVIPTKVETQKRFKTYCICRSKAKQAACLEFCLKYHPSGDTTASRPSPG